MAHNASKPISNLSAGFAAQSASVDVPKHRDAGHPSTFQALPHKQHTLPTPPNSISPTLPPHKLRSPSLRTSQAHQLPVDSDIDLQDAVDHAASQGHPQALSTAALSGLEAAGAITPAMLARDHLPEILLGSGPMAIRHVLSHLTQTVPGFSRIPPAKARRIVVGALESRGGGGPDCDVLFEKVGWGRWDARLRGQPLRDGRIAQANLSQDGAAQREAALSPPASLPGSYALSNASGLQIPRAHHMGADGRRDIYSGASWTGDSVISSRDEEMDDMNMAEHEADKMSLDGIDDSISPNDSPISDDPDDATDEEDWAGLGPQAPRQPPTRKGQRVDYNYLSYSTSARMRGTSSGYMKSMSGQQRRASSNTYSHTHSNRGSAYPGGSVPRAFSTSMTTSGYAKRDVQDVNTQERDAIEALLRMGSM